MIAKIAKSNTVFVLFTVLILKIIFRNVGATIKVQIPSRTKKLGKGSSSLVLRCENLRQPARIPEGLDGKT